MRRLLSNSVFAGGMVLYGCGNADAQDRLNQANPSILERALPRPAEPRSKAETAPVEVTARPALATHLAPPVASAIVIDGATEISRDRFTSALLPYLGRDLSNDDLAKLSSAVANVARDSDYPFASAWIEPQTLPGGVLRVRLDLGVLSAVRVIGAINPQADRVLTRALVTNHAVQRSALERAILLVGDIPGVTVMESKYVRQDSFGILLVTISQDRTSAYAQIDNRGSKEVGPIRSTVLGNVRDLIQSGDELSIIAAQTPVEPSEFIFVRARYSAPVDSDGATLSASASYGRAKPGASLAPLDVIGQSIDAAVSYSKPLLRSRARSVWGVIEFRGLRSDQTLLTSPLRNDRLATLTASLNGSVKAGAGTLRAQVIIVGGLPFPGVTHEGDPRISRSDGDARFVTLGYNADWTTRLFNHISLVLASEAQVASRPLLATAEIGAGGPAFGRAYDYAERTGDNGILGSGEMRVDFGRVIPGVIDRVQLYSSVDGGYVANLRDGSGGGALLSTSAGVRLGRGRLGGMVEVALPLNQDRFDTANRNPRISFRLSRVF